MTDIMDALDSINGAEAEVQQFWAEFMAEWMAPAQMVMLKEGARAVMAADPVAVEMLRQQHPDEMAMIEEIAGGE